MEGGAVNCKEPNWASSNNQDCTMRLHLEFRSAAWETRMLKLRAVMLMSPGEGRFVQSMLVTTKCAQRPFLGVQFVSKNPRCSSLSKFVETR